MLILPVRHHPLLCLCCPTGILRLLGSIPALALLELFGFFVIFTCMILMRFGL